MAILSDPFKQSAWGNYDTMFGKKGIQYMYSCSLVPRPYEGRKKGLYRALVLDPVFSGDEASRALTASSGIDTADSVRAQLGTVLSLKGSLMLVSSQKNPLLSATIPFFSAK